LFTIPGIVLVLDFGSPPPAALAAGVFLPPAWGVVYILYRFARPDVTALAMGLTSLCSVVLTIIGRLLLEDGDGFAIRLLLFGFIVLGIFAAAGVFLQRTARIMRQVQRG
jgi:hypothetical protein